MFYDTFLRLCSERNESPSKAAEGAGLKPAHVTRWKNGSTPTDATLIKLSNYFGVSPEFLKTGVETKKESPAPKSEGRKPDELYEMLDALTAEQREEVLKYAQFRFGRR